MNKISQDMLRVYKQHIDDIRNDKKYENGILVCVAKSRLDECEKYAEKLAIEFEKIEQIKQIVNNVLYFDDNSDYQTALWEVLALINDWDEEDVYEIKLQYID